MYKHVIFQSEFFSRKLAGESYNGYYILTEYKFSSRYTLGAMLERISLPHIHEENEEFELESETVNGFSTALSYFPSDFQRLRLQFDYHNEEEFKEKRLLLQWTFIIGPHKPHGY